LRDLSFAQNLNQIIPVFDHPLFPKKTRREESPRVKARKTFEIDYGVFLPKDIRESTLGDAAVQRKLPTFKPGLDMSSCP
jgi:hypothetical protein